MIRSIRHKGLKALHERGQAKAINPSWLKRVRAILARLDASADPGDMDMPGLRLHALRGDLAGFYAVDVSGNWRIVFRFDGDDVVDVDLIDYH